MDLQKFQMLLLALLMMSVVIIVILRTTLDEYLIPRIDIASYKNNSSRLPRLQTNSEQHGTRPSPSNSTVALHYRRQPPSKFINQTFASQQSPNITNSTYQSMQYNNTDDKLYQAYVPNNFTGWNNTAFTEYRNKIRKSFHVDQVLLIYDSDVTSDNMWFTTTSEEQNRTHSIPFQRTCAVVGNGGILLNSSCGQEIDNHDVVMRINLPDIEGYETDVGKKQNITTINYEKLRSFAKQITRKRSKNINNPAIQKLIYLNGTILWYPLGHGSLGKLKSIVKEGKSIGAEYQVAFSPKSLMTYTKKIWHKSLPSSGLNLFTVAATFCEQISLYGFYPFYEDRHNKTLKYHYYDDTVYNMKRNLHKLPTEFSHFVGLHNQGIIRLVIDKCQ